MASVAVGGEKHLRSGDSLGETVSGRALEQDSWKVAPHQWVVGPWLGDMVAGLPSPERNWCTFNNGNMHFTNERINSREMVFLATVALCFKGVCFI